MKIKSFVVDAKKGKFLKNNGIEINAGKTSIHDWEKT